jgi:hypothetical protein
MAPKPPKGSRDKESKEIAKELVGLLKDQLDLEEDISSFAFKRLGIEKQVNDVTKSILSSTGKTLIVEKDKAKAAIEDVKLKTEGAKLIDNQLSGLLSMSNGMKKIVFQARAFTTALLLNPFVAIGAAIVAATTALIAFAKQTNEIREDLGVSATNAAKLNIQLQIAKVRGKAFLLEAEKIESAFDALTDEFGVANGEVVSLSVELARVARNTGISAEQAAQFTSLISAATGQSKELAIASIESLAAFAELEGVAPGKILEELAENADTFASFIGNSEKELVRAAAAAKKLGANFDTLVGFGDELLDVSERINKEQLLSTILGKQISLERFTALTAQDRLGEAQEEFRRQLQGINSLTSQQIRLASDVLPGGVAELRRLTGNVAGITAGAPATRVINQSDLGETNSILKDINTGIDNLVKTTRRGVFN